MLLRDLEILVQRGEGERLEFKHKAADPQKIMKEVVAFANHRGGRLLLGVNDDLKINGVRFAAEEEFAMSKAIETYCKPVPEYSVERVVLNQQRTVLIYRIAQSETKPVFLIYNLKKKSGRAYFRVADKSVQASRELRKILKWRSQGDSDSFFQFGDVERLLVRKLEEQGSITLKKFAAYAKISEEEASETLVRLTISNLIEIHPRDEEDLYSMKES